MNNKTGNEKENNESNSYKRFVSAIENEVRFFLSFKIYLKIFLKF